MKIALDVGYGSVKIVSGRSQNDLANLIYPAAAAPLAQRDQSLSGRIEGGVTVDVDGVPYSALVEPSRFENFARPLHQDYTTTPAYKALFLAALQVVGAPEVDCLVTGLPTRHAFDESRRAAVRQLMAGTHQVSPHLRVRVREVRIMSQPVGAFVDHVYQTRSQIALQSNVLVLDIGFGTADWAVLHQGNLRSQSSDSSFQAMSVVLERAATQINANYRGARLQVERLESALRAGQSAVPLFGQMVEMAPYLNEAAAEVVPVVMSELMRRVRNEAGQIDMVILAGGGANLFRSGVEQVVTGPPIHVSADPVHANARGFWLSTLSRSARAA